MYDIINTCFETTKDSHTIAYYSHLVPLFLSLFIGIFVFIKSRYSFVSRAFLLFIVPFCFWLFGDLITWVSRDYYAVAFYWSILDYLDIVFYLAAVYFFAVLLKGSDVGWKLKVFLTALALPGLVVVVLGKAIGDFNQPVCEAFNNDFLTFYKFAAEGICLLAIAHIGFLNFKKGDRVKRRQTVVIATSLIFFLILFGATEYIASETAYYEVNLYSLFILPVFLFVMIVSIVRLQLFELRILGTQLLVYVLVIMIASQFFFLQSSVDKSLNAVALLVSVGFSYLLMRNVRKEIEAREQIEKLAKDLQKANDRLKELDIQKSEFVSFATHQLRSPLTAMKGYASLILEGDLGEIPREAKEATERIYESSQTLTNVVDDYLNISRIELGTMKYSLNKLDWRNLVEEIIGELKPNVEKAGLVLDFLSDSKDTYTIEADSDKFKQVIANLIDNSVKYTPQGRIDVSLAKSKDSGKILFSIKDTGIGMSQKTLPKLFQKFTRADKASETNIRGTGLGLYVAKQIVEAHHGRIWAQSEGEGKGSQFYVEMDDKGVI